jgi:hypothetical protein
MRSNNENEVNQELLSVAVIIKHAVLLALLMILSALLNNLRIICNIEENSPVNIIFEIGERSFVPLYVLYLVIEILKNLLGKSVKYQFQCL